MPFFSGFFSKDEIIDNAHHNGYTVFLIVGLIGVFLTTAYMTGRRTSRSSASPAALRPASTTMPTSTPSVAVTDAHGHVHAEVEVQTRARAAMAPRPMALTPTTMPMPGRTSRRR